jgi:hypothetical protein
MANTLTIRFTGLCGFVPKRPTIPPNSNNEMTVLLNRASVSAAMAGHCTGGGHQHSSSTPIDAHVPILHLPLDQLKDQGQADFVFGKRAAFFLTGYEVSIEGASPRSLSVTDGDLTANDPNNDPNEYWPILPDDQRFSWVAPISQALNAPQVDPACGGKGETLHPDVAARFRLRQGTLGISPRSINQEVYIFGLKAKSEAARPGDYAQFLAEEVVYTYDPGGRDVFLYFDAQAHDVASWRLQLNGGVPLDLVVVNLPLFDALGSRKGEEPILNGHRSGDEHFDHFYRFLSAAFAPGQGRIPYAKRRIPGNSSVTHPRCPPARYLPEEA